MSRKKTVQLNYPAAKAAIDKNFRSNVVFCEAMGFQNRNSWVSDLKRNKNLPSPEEAARMCILLNTTPEELLLCEGSTEAETARCQQDIETVRRLVEEARGAEKAPDPKIEGLSAAKKALLAAVDGMTDEQCEKLLPIVLSAKKVL
jgi:hypothetical protein